MAEKKFWVIASVLTASQLISVGLGFKVVSTPRLSLEPAPQKKIPFHVPPPASKILGTILEEHLEKSGENYLRCGESSPVKNPIAKPPRPARNPDDDRLFAMTAAWVYVGFRSINELREGKFCCLTTRKKTGWLPEKRFLEEGLIASLTPRKAVLELNDATLELNLVTLNQNENPDIQLPTPERIAREEKRYRDLYLRRMQALSRRFNQLYREKGLIVADSSG